VHYENDAILVLQNSVEFMRPLNVTCIYWIVWANVHFWKGHAARIAHDRVGAEYGIVDEITPRGRYLPHEHRYGHEANGYPNIHKHWASSVVPYCSFHSQIRKH
jgi:hypothetical protein